MIPFWTVRVVTPSGTRLAPELGRPPVQVVRPRPTAAEAYRGEPPASSQSSRWRRVRGLRRISRLLLVFAALQILDMASTLLLLSIGGTEMNPVAAWSLQRGVLAFVGLKLGLAGVLAAFIPLLERDRSPARAATWTALGMDCVFALVVATNLIQFVLFA